MNVCLQSSTQVPPEMLFTWMATMLLPGNYVITWDSQIVVKDLLQERLLVRVGHVTNELVESVGSCYKDKVLLRSRDPVEFQSCDGGAVSLTDVKHL